MRALAIVVALAGVAHADAADQLVAALQHGDVARAADATHLPLELDYREIGDGQLAHATHETLKTPAALAAFVRRFAASGRLVHAKRDAAPIQGDIRFRADDNYDTYVHVDGAQVRHITFAHATIGI